MNEDYEMQLTEQESNEQEAPAKENETKSEKFLRLAPPRVNKVLNGIEALKRLSVRASYEYTPEQVEKMFSAIKSSLESCEKAFEPKPKSDGEGFAF